MIVISVIYSDEVSTEPYSVAVQLKLMQLIQERAIDAVNASNEILRVLSMQQCLQNTPGV